MDIRPIDIQLMMSSSEVNKTAEAPKYAEQQQFFSSQLEQKTQNEMQKAVSAAKSDNETISDRQESNKGQYKGKRKKRRSEGKNKKSAESGGSNSLFDVKI